MEKVFEILKKTMLNQRELFLFSILGRPDKIVLMQLYDTALEKSISITTNEINKLNEAMPSDTTKDHHTGSYPDDYNPNNPVTI